MSLGIHAVRFNRFIPTLNTYLNYRNHRKMTIIDGNVGYMGGINLADEYINKKVRFGYWKDTGIMLRGEGTANMTALFLQMWEYVTGEDMPPLENYLPTAKLPADGYVQPFADSPLDDINIGESTYLQIIHNARKYVYITTPYLVLDNEMITALTIAAQSGVDVRILTPGIPDKKLVYMITRSYYQQLHRAGVKIYEYRPGFLHAKTIVSDDDTVRSTWISARSSCTLSARPASTTARSLLPLSRTLWRPSMSAAGLMTNGCAVCRGFGRSWQACCVCSRRCCNERSVV